MLDKEIEQKRYNYFSSKVLNSKTDVLDRLSILGGQNFPKYLQAPYLKYQSLIKEQAISKNNLLQLDLCCGDGTHSFTAAIEGASVIALDYAENSIEIAKKRASIIGLNVDFRVCDVENLPFNDDYFDLVTCAGSLSYLELDGFINEVKRVLKPGGVFICVDSFNHNVIYKFNRYLHYLKKERSYSTLQRMPNVKSIKRIESLFSSFNISYYGTFSFMAPVLSKLFGEEKAAKTIDKLDELSPFLKKYAFKIVFKAVK